MLESKDGIGFGIVRSNKIGPEKMIQQASENSTALIRENEDVESGQKVGNDDQLQTTKEMLQANQSFGNGGVQAEEELVKEDDQDEQGGKSCWKKLPWAQLVSILTGFIFGFALDKGKTNVPYIIQEQMQLRNWVMVRMFLGAAATSAAVILLLDVAGLKNREPKGGIKMGFNVMAGFGANIVGGLIMGSAFYIAGSCPGTVWSQLGAGIPYTWAIFAGGVVGTLLFGYFERPFKSKMQSFHKRRSTAFDITTKKYYYVLAVVMIIAFSLIIYGINVASFWVEDMEEAIATPFSIPKVPFDPSATVWDPLTAGIVVGLLQIPLQLGPQGALGASSGWVTLTAAIANLFDDALPENAPYLHSALSCPRSKFQLISGFAMIAGGACSQYLSDYPALTPEAADGSGSVLRSFFGGLLLLFGARFGGGCTSGHGLSGVGTASLASMVSVGAMFAGGILTAMISRLWN